MLILQFFIMRFYCVGLAPDASEFSIRWFYGRKFNKKLSFHANFLELFSLLTQNCVAEVAVCVHSTQFHQGRDGFQTCIHCFLIVLQWRCNDGRDGQKGQRWPLWHLQQLTHQARRLLTIINTRAAGAEMTLMPSVMVGKTGAAT